MCILLIYTSSLCDVGAVLFQLNYQANLGAGHYVTLLMHDNA